MFKKILDILTKDLVSYLLSPQFLASFFLLQSFNLTSMTGNHIVNDHDWDNQRRKQFIRFLIMECKKVYIALINCIVILVL